MILEMVKEGVFMNPQDILLALQDGKISLDDAERQLTEKIETAPCGKQPEAGLNPKNLGSPVFQKRYGCMWSYFAGSMYRGISSEELVIAMGKANLLSFFGSAGIVADELEKHIRNIQFGLGKNRPYGMCLIAGPDNPRKEIEQVELYIRYGVPVIEAAAYLSATAPLVYLRIKGIFRHEAEIFVPRRIIGKCSNLKVAQIFLSPPPEDTVRELLNAGLISSEEAELARFIPLADDLAIEADSGGHTDQGVAFSLIPAISALRDKIKRQFNYREEILVGCGGGIGTPQAVISAFMLGADFIFTGSVNQCTAESGANAAVKDMLNTLSIHDTGITVAGDMFEIGAKVQVVKKGTKFAQRANKLYQLFSQYNSFEEIPESTRTDIEKNYFKKTLSEVWDLVYEYKIRKNPEQLREAEENPRIKMSLILKWYFSHCSSITLEGDLTEKDNFLIYCGPALGAFNQWVKGTACEHWKNRHVDEIASLLLTGACRELLEKGRVLYHTQNADTEDGLEVNKDTRPYNTNGAIAVIGMSGQFPKADTLTEFWENLKSGVNCIEEVPKARWDMDKYFDPDIKAEGKTCSRWMGVLENADKFDPLFFNISPAEAEIMDPQQRLFLENSWKCIEDAGLLPSSLSGSRCGVFVGCASGEYQELAGENGLSAQGLMGRAMSILSARISYLLNLKGPCLAIETACSSSLVAIAEACNNLVLGNCDLALSGGVCVIAGPTTHIMTSKSGMLSNDGHCYTFDNRANGFVPGEGVGVVLLKRLNDAERDGDHIYGVIRGWGINQDGKTNGITAPSVISQIQLEKDVYKKFGINPENISLVEAHGTGTKLGDPIEVEALTETFRAFTQKKNYCALGSVKTNIGHLMTAAGSAGFIKVMLAIKNRMLPPSINFKTINEHISINDSPFYINSALKPWNIEYGKTRCACISAFGFSGTNAHIVVEEHQPSDLPASLPVGIYKEVPLLFVLSAKSDEQLKNYAESLKTYVEQEEATELKELACTLQTGRENMDYRLGFVFCSKKDLLHSLKAFINGISLETVYTGHVNKKNDLQGNYKSLINNAIQNKEPHKLAELWVKGIDIDWRQLYGKEKLRRISLPTYPFSREHYWVPAKAAGCGCEGNSNAFIHPLLHHNTSSLSEQRYTSVFTGEEIFLSHHIVKKQKVLPGAAYLEMARAAVEKATADMKEGQSRFRLKNIVWSRPIIVNEEPVKITTGIYAVSDTRVDYEIYKETENAEETTCFQGSAVLSEDVSEEILNIEALKLKCNEEIISAEQCYEAFANAGIEYGDGHRGIEKIYSGKGQVLAKLSLKPQSMNETEGYVLHPGMLDSALQASIGMMWELGNGEVYLPFSLDELEIVHHCTAEMWVHICQSKGYNAGDNLKKLDIRLCDKNGKVCVRMNGFSSRKLEDENNVNTGTDFDSTLLFKPVWEKQPIINTSQTLKHTSRIAVFCGFDEAVSEIIRKKLNGIRCLTLDFVKDEPAEKFTECAVQLFEEIRKILADKISGNVLIQVVVPSGEDGIFGGLSGLLKTAERENPKLKGQLIEIADHNIRGKIADILDGNALHLQNGRVRYIEEQRFTQEWEETEIADKNIEIPWKKEGRYLITGGMGGLGLIFAREIADKTENAVLILTGRSAPGKEKQALLKTLEESGVRVEFKAADISKSGEVKKLVNDITSEFGGLDGIIHSAGVIDDNFIIKKDADSFRKVLAPKVNGLVNLDIETCDLPLDFFIVFSSLAGVLGNAGQSDYSAANAFMDSYSIYRGDLAASGKRRGRTLSINWPLWRNGGMRVSEETLGHMKQDSGISAMTTEAGIKAFYQCMASGKQQVLVSNGEAKKIRLQLDKLNLNTVVSGEMQAAEADGIREIREDKVEGYLKKLISSVIKLSPERIESAAPFEKYGIDSIMVMDLTAELEKNFGGLSKTLLFEYQNIRELTGYFKKEHSGKLHKLLGAGKEEVHSSGTLNTRYHKDLNEEVAASGRRNRRFISAQSEARNKRESASLDIAIIGVSGRYPGADDLRQFWDNLQNGRDCISEIPKDRWDHSLYFDRDKNRKGKTYTKWGGFINDVDCFDPLFFNISPREAELMDPQERLFLECVYETLEDAGYTRSDLSTGSNFDTEGNVGVFAGVMYEEYQLYGVEETLKGRPAAYPGNASSVANRVSYFFNFNGPSIALDTMCSSSLTAIQLACHSLLRNECRLAVAGGVNVSIHPNKYLILGQGKFASSKGRCESFGQGGDGYVPGEGVGAVLLKPLSRAVEDGDHIYGVIKGIAVNHGGKTNGYTVPNPNAQAGVIKRAFKEAGINPRSISYIEAHGTGTSLGDPIEITGLTKAFREYTDDKQFCAIGSAKSNIGHCESAAGIAGVTKVLLQMKYGKLTPSLHSSVTNPNIDFENTPFAVQRELVDWKRPVLKIEGEENEYPRLAGISSFGAGGSNAHIIIEEYIPEKGKTALAECDTDNEAVIILSAKSGRQLKKTAKRLLESIEEGQYTGDDLADIAYTLQIGREAMEERLAFTAGSIKELVESLKQFTEASNYGDKIKLGSVKDNKDILNILTDDSDIERAIFSWMENKKYEKLTSLWVKGVDIVWNKLYKYAKPRRISLPAYPFEKERYWAPAGNAGEINRAADKSVLHPLLHKNTSSIFGLQFSSIFTGHETFLADHVVNGNVMLPGVAFLEMAIEAVKQADALPQDGNAGLKIKNIIWGRPLIIGEKPVRADIGLYPEEKGGIVYEVRSKWPENETESVLYSQGTIEVQDIVKESGEIDLEALKAECGTKILTAEQCYAAFETSGFHYGPHHRGIKKIYTGDKTVLAKLSLSEELFNTDDDFVLHPGITDSALQASIGMFPENEGRTALPFAIGEVEIIEGCSSSMWAVLRHNSESTAGAGVLKLDIDLCNDSGKICIRIKRLALRMAEEQASAGNIHGKLAASQIRDEFYVNIIEKISKGELSEEQLEELMRVS